jgi:hypothetical protein
MPRNIYGHVEDALNRIVEEFGSVDKYVEDKLEFKKYSSKALSDALGAEQVDNIAMSIYQMEQGNGMIIGDMAGVGKGRVAAALLHYGRLQGQTPVFITKNANLFTDLWRDFVGIGIEDMNPLITNVPTRENDSNMYTEEGKLVHRAPSSDKRKKIMTVLADPGKMSAALDQYDFVVSTYSQVNREDNAVQKALPNIARDNFLIMDESHNAAGSESNTGEFFRNLIPLSKGTTFLSATYAKFPKNMALYNNTIMRAYDPDDLIIAMHKGGVPLQEIVSGALAQAGQYTRHERSYDGVRFEPVEMVDTFVQDKKAADDVTEILRDMVRLDGHLGAIVSSVDKGMKAQATMGGRVKVPKTMRQHANFAPFASRVHNIITQLMLALKVENAVTRALAVIKDGKKPIITMANTMETILKHFVSEADIAVGGSIDYNFASVLDRALERQLMYTIKNPNGATELVPIDWEGDDVTRSAVNALKDKIQNLFTDLSASPMDVIRDHLEAHGYQIGEISGRGLKIDYSVMADPRLALREKEEKDKRTILNRFNNGKGKERLDGLIVNRSASTGLSLHASEEFKDQRPRVMITIQPELDINEMVQMFGRIFRTGQVALPEYELLFTGLPLEKRPAAILMNKMKSLNANVSRNLFRRRRFYEYLRR